MKYFQNKHFLLLLFSSSFILLCQNYTSSPVIARVGKATLTVDDLKKSIPSEYSAQITHEQNINYVKQWIDAELFFQEALRNKIDKNPEIKNRLKKMKKDLLAAELMNRIAINEQSAKIDNNTIHAYYELNKDKYIREHDLVKYIDLSIADSKAAWYISRNGTMDNILTLAAEYSQDPIPDNLNTPYILLESIPLEFKNTLISTAAGSASVPVKTDSTYHVYFIIEKLDQGEICKEDEVHEDIYNYLSNKAQKESIETFLAELRLKTNVEFNTELINNTFQNQKSSQPQ